MIKIGNQIITRVVVGTNDMNSVVVGGTQVFPDNSYLKVQVAKEYAVTTNSSVHYLPINNETITAYGNDIGDLIDGLIPGVDSQNLPARVRVLSVEVNTTTALTTTQNSFRKVVIDAGDVIRYTGKIRTFQIPESSKVTIGENTFYSTNLYRIGVNINSATNVLPSSVVLNAGCFYSTQLQNLTLPSNLLEIPRSILKNCSALTSVVVGKKTGWFTSLAYSNNDLKNFIDMRNASTAATYLKSTYANDTLYRMSTAQGTVNIWKNGYILNTTAGATFSYVSNSSWSSFNGIMDVPPGASTFSWDTVNFMNTYDSNRKLLRPQLWSPGTTYTLNSTDKLICGSILNANYAGTATVTFNFEE